MGGEFPIRQYLVLDRNRARANIVDRDGAALERYLAGRLGIGRGKPKRSIFRVPMAASRPWVLELAEGADDCPSGGPQAPSVVPVEFTDRAACRRFRTASRKTDEILGMGSDLSFGHVGQHWSPREATMPLFADRAAALSLIAAGTLAEEGLRGQGVNVVVVDRGIDARQIPHFGGGWSKPGDPAFPKPGTTRGGHGAMVVRNVLSVAPDARLFDLPLIPEAIVDVSQFLSEAQAAFEQVLADIDRLRRHARWQGPWILVNAWAIFRLDHDAADEDYARNPDHPFNAMIARALGNGIDVIFGAGNCGTFCPDMRCGAVNRAPGEAIFGAHALPGAITVGAVRSDGMWLGYSSQGPGPSTLATEKPDLCAPSQFGETGDHHAGNTGTSAACGMAAAVVAALRTRWRDLSPARMHAILRESARKPAGAGWNDRLGHGILDAAAALARAKQRYPRHRAAA